MDTTKITQSSDVIIKYLLENGPKVAGALAILVVGIIVARIVGNLTQHWLGKRELDPPLRMLITRVIRLLVFVFALIIALGTCGINITPLVTLMGVAGVGIGLALQGVLGNLVAGLVIIFTRPFRVGEYIEIIGCYGQVSVIELFSTTLIHPDKSRVVIPNRKIVGEVLHNYGSIRQHDITVLVSYGTNLTQAIGVIQEVLGQNPKVLKDPAPMVAINAFHASGIQIAVQPWSQVAEYGPVAGAIKLAIADAFRARRIEIPLPQQEIRVLNAGPGATPFSAGAA